MEVKIDLEKLALNNLTPNEYSILWSLANNKEYYWLNNNREDKLYLNKTLKELENKLFVKILEDRIELRSKAKSLGLGEKSYSDDISIVIDYLNEKLENTGKKGFRATTEGNAKHIRARLKEGYSTDDLISVIDEMYSRWGVGSMRRYLRPQTLFDATKFQGYFNSVEDNLSKNSLNEERV